MWAFMKKSVCLFILLLSGCLIHTQAQKFGRTRGEEQFIKETSIIKSEAVELKDIDSSFLAGYTLPEFNNIGKIDYYYDKSSIKIIQKIARTGNHAELNNLLFNYIQNFGIENFRKDADLLWKAGWVKEQLGDTALATFFYRLAFKHNKMGFPIQKMATDSFLAPVFDPTSGTALPVREYVSEWVNIDKYYEILELRMQIDTLKPPKVLVKMGGEVNSENPEYAPYTHFSDSILIFTSRREVKDYSDPFARKNEDLYMAFRIWEYDTAYWDTAFVMPEAVNSKFNEGSACLSPDGKTLYFTRCGEGSKGYGECDLYEVKMESPGKWGKAENLGPKINTPYWESQPNITPDGNTLFFSSNRKGGFGGIDIYAATKDEKGRWQTAQNLGPVINTHQNEVTPFYHKINRTLYFSSNGQILSFGNYDIYKSRRLLTSWEEPKNVGPLVNTPGNEYYFSIDGKGEILFYSRSDGRKSHLEQNFDLYSFDMPMEARPDAITTIKGYLIDSRTQKPLVGTIMVIDLDNGVEIAPKKINSKGYFEFELRKNNRYRLYVLGDNFLTIKNDVEVNRDTSFQIFVESLERDKPIIFESMEFGSNSYKLKTNVKPQLDYLVEFLTKYPMFQLVVEGHTDSDGEEQNNFVLSKRRANSIKDYIMANGNFRKDQIIANGYGESKPIVPNDTPGNKRKNRRVEFRLLFDDTYKGDRPLPTKDELFFRIKNNSGVDAMEDLDSGTGSPDH